MMTVTKHPQKTEYKAGKLLVAMPGMQDPRFAHAIVYICAHGAEGAMGLVINKALERMTLSDLLKQLGINPTSVDPNAKIHFGGPVDTGLGFILHSTDYKHDSTMQVDGELALTATVDILHAMAAGHGPRRALMALGYAGWGPGQLDQEILNNGWMVVDPDRDLVFGDDLDSKWARAFAKIGVPDTAVLSPVAGHA
jgi:putative transcriptional regulator